MLAPVHRLKKSEINWLAKHTCKKHRHAYLNHYECFLAEGRGQERVGFFDIETTNLNAAFGIMLCYCIKDAATGEVLGKCIDRKQLETVRDREIVKACVADLQKFDRVVTQYGERFDLPFIRTRAVALSLPFPEFGELFQTDVWKILRKKFRLHSNRLEAACKVLLGRTEKTHLEPDYWIGALMGDKKALAYIYDHCEKDVSDLEKLYNKVCNYAQKRDESI